VTCANGHDAERRYIAGKSRCMECYREGNRRRSQRVRERKQGRLPATTSTLRCPYCHLIPCRCEEL
jgi:hypothetical protein